MSMDMSYIELKNYCKENKVPKYTSKAIKTKEDFINLIDEWRKTKDVPDTRDEYEKMSRLELVEFAKSKNIKGYFSANKTELLRLIRQWQKYNERVVPDCIKYNNYVRKLEDEFKCSVITTKEDYIQQYFDLQDGKMVENGNSHIMWYNCSNGHKNRLTFNALGNKFASFGKSDVCFDICSKCNLEIISEEKKKVVELCEKFNYKLVCFNLETRFVEYICICGVNTIVHSSSIIQRRSRNEKSPCVHAVKKYTFPSGKEILLQGYELVSIDKLLTGNTDNRSRIKRPLTEDEIIAGDRELIPCIRYISEDGRNRRYFPDFFIPHENLIIEIKSIYFYNIAHNKNYLKFVKTSETYNFELWIINEDGSYLKTASYTNGKGIWDDGTECKGGKLVKNKKTNLMEEINIKLIDENKSLENEDLQDNTENCSYEKEE